MAKEKILLKENDLLIEEKDSVMDIRDLEIENNATVAPDDSESYEGGDEAATEMPAVKKERKKRWGDRCDGRLLRTLTPFSRVIPFIMPRRSDAQNYFEDIIDITAIEDYIAEKHAAGYKNVGLLHVIIAAYVRTIAQRPGVNRFVAGQRVYARKGITGVMTIKKYLAVDSPDTSIKVNFDPYDTVLDVCRKFTDTAEKALSANTDFDKTAAKLVKMPRFLFRAAIRFLMWLDYHGRLPKSLLNVSPFHGSFVITSMGSLGIDAIYHHIYDFGNLPVFISYGKKITRNVIEKDGTVTAHHYITFRVVTDERICDGYYYASAFKLLKRYMLHPDWLDVPPREILEDID